VERRTKRGNKWVKEVRKYKIGYRRPRTAKNPSEGLLCKSPAKEKAWQIQKEKTGRQRKDQRGEGKALNIQRGPASGSG